MFAPDPTTMEANFKLSLDFKSRLLASLMQNALIKYTAKFIQMSVR